MHECHRALPDPWAVASTAARVGRCTVGRAAVAALLGRAHHEVLSLMPVLDGESTEDWSDWSPPDNCRSVRIIVSAECKAQHTAALARSAEVRVGRSISSYLLLVDRRIAVLSDGRSEAQAAIQSPAAVAELIDVFERHWSRARPLLAHHQEAISALDHLIITRLAAGLTDAAVANELAISIRTVQRHVTRLMNVLGARSRLELGIYLERRHLI
jgi:Bacterial regulatory proteins, luxR family